MAKAYQCDRCKKLCFEAATNIASSFHESTIDEPFIVIVSFRKADVKNEKAELCLDCQHELLLTISDEWEQLYNKTNAPEAVTYREKPSLRPKLAIRRKA